MLVLTPLHHCWTSRLLAQLPARSMSFRGGMLEQVHELHCTPRLGSTPVQWWRELSQRIDFQWKIWCGSRLSILSYHKVQVSGNTYHKSTVMTHDHLPLMLVLTPLHHCWTSRLLAQLPARSMSFRGGMLEQVHELHCTPRLGSTPVQWWRELSQRIDFQWKIWCGSRLSILSYHKVQVSGNTYHKSTVMTHDHLPLMLVLTPLHHCWTSRLLAQLPARSMSFRGGMLEQVHELHCTPRLGSTPVQWWRELSQRIDFQWKIWCGSRLSILSYHKVQVSGNTYHKSTVMTHDHLPLMLVLTPLHHCWTSRLLAQLPARSMSFRGGMLEQVHELHCTPRLGSTPVQWWRELSQRIDFQWKIWCGSRLSILSYHKVQVSGNTYHKSTVMTHDHLPLMLVLTPLHHCWTSRLLAQLPARSMSFRGGMLEQVHELHCTPRLGSTPVQWWRELSQRIDFQWKIWCGSRLSILSYHKVQVSGNTYHKSTVMTHDHLPLMLVLTPLHHCWTSRLLAQLPARSMSFRGGMLEQVHELHCTPRLGSTPVQWWRELSQRIDFQWKIWCGSRLSILSYHKVQVSGNTYHKSTVMTHDHLPLMLVLTPLHHCWTSRLLAQLPARSMSFRGGMLEQVHELHCTPRLGSTPVQWWRELSQRIDFQWKIWCGSRLSILSYHKVQVSGNTYHKSTVMTHDHLPLMLVLTPLHHCWTSRLLAQLPARSMSFRGGMLEQVHELHCTPRLGSTPVQWWKELSQRIDFQWKIWCGNRLSILSYHKVQVSGNTYHKSTVMTHDHLPLMLVLTPLHHCWTSRLLAQLPARSMSFRGGMLEQVHELHCTPRLGSTPVQWWRELSQRIDFQWKIWCGSRLSILSYHKVQVSGNTYHKSTVMTHDHLPLMLVLTPLHHCWTSRLLAQLPARSMSFRGGMLEQVHELHCTPRLGSTPVQWWRELSQRIDFQWKIWCGSRLSILSYHKVQVSGNTYHKSTVMTHDHLPLMLVLTPLHHCWTSRLLAQLPARSMSFRGGMLEQVHELHCTPRLGSTPVQWWRELSQRIDFQWKIWCGSRLSILSYHKVQVSGNTYHKSTVMTHTHLPLMLVLTPLHHCWTSRLLAQLPARSMSFRGGMLEQVHELHCTPRLGSTPVQWWRELSQRIDFQWKIWCGSRLSILSYHKVQVPLTHHHTWHPPIIQPEKTTIKGALRLCLHLQSNFTLRHLETIDDHKTNTYHNLYHQMSKFTMDKWLVSWMTSILSQT